MLYTCVDFLLLTTVYGDDIDYEMACEVYKTLPISNKIAAGTDVRERGINAYDIL